MWLVAVSVGDLTAMSFTSLVFVILGLVASSFGYFFVATIHGRLLDVMSVFMQYSAFIPTMINTFAIYR